MKIAALKNPIRFEAEITTYVDGKPVKNTVTGLRKPVTAKEINTFTAKDRIDQILAVLIETGFEDESGQPIKPTREFFDEVGWEEVIEPFYEACFSGFMPEKKAEG